MAQKKRVATKTTKTKASGSTRAAKAAGLLRGDALVDAVVARIQSGESKIKVITPRPLTEEQLERLVFSNGAPFPPSLKRFLAFDSSWLRRKLPWSLSGEAPIHVDSVARIVFDNLSEVFASAFQPLPRGVTHGRAVARSRSMWGQTRCGCFFWV